MRELAIEPPPIRRNVPSYQCAFKHANMGGTEASRHYRWWPASLQAILYCSLLV